MTPKPEIFNLSLEPRQIASKFQQKFRIFDNDELDKMSAIATTTDKQKLLIIAKTGI